MERFRKIKKGDLLFILLVGLIIIVVTPLSWNHQVQGKNDNTKPLVAEIRREGKLVQEIDLNKIKEPKYINLEDGIHLTVLAEKGRVRVFDADCPNQICVEAGWLTEPGDMAVCIPSDTTVMIKVP